MSLMLNESLALMNRHQWHSRAGEMTSKQKDLNKATLLSMIESAC